MENILDIFRLIDESINSGNSQLLDLTESHGAVSTAYGELDNSFVYSLILKPVNLDELGTVVDANKLYKLYKVLFTIKLTKESESIILIDNLIESLQDLKQNLKSSL